VSRCWYCAAMPALWRDSIDAHRQAVRDSVLDASGAILEETGMTGLTMSAVAERAGIGRAALYRYFSDSRQIVLAWHERQVRTHLDQLLEVRAGAGGTDRAVRDVLEAYAGLSSAHDIGESAAVLHTGEHMEGAQRELHLLLRDLLADGVRHGQVRGDINVDDLATYCAHALGAASHMTSPDAPRTVTALVLDALRPGSSTALPPNKAGHLHEHH